METNKAVLLNSCEMPPPRPTLKETLQGLKDAMKWKIDPDHRLLQSDYKSKSISEIAIGKENKYRKNYFQLVSTKCCTLLRHLPQTEQSLALRNEIFLLNEKFRVLHDHPPDTIEKDVHAIDDIAKKVILIAEEYLEDGFATLQTN